MPGDVSTPNSVYRSLEARWERCRDCSDGSDAIKAKLVKYLPPLDSHVRDGILNNKYNAYILRALFYNAVGRTIQGLSGAIFQKSPNVVVDSSAVEHVKDITLTGQPLELFALNTTKEYLVTGRYGILIDMSGEESTTPRPYWVGYKAEDIVNWRFENFGGDQELSFVVLRQMIETVDDDDEFCAKEVTKYLVLRLTGGVYSQQEYIPVKDVSGKTEFQGQEIVIPLRRAKPLDFIPFAIPWAVNAPPLLDLVDVSLSHFRGSADLKHGLHFTALPTPWVSGQQGDTSKPLSIGSGTAWSLDINGKAGMLEFTGHGLGAIRQDLQDMQRMMATLGARLLEEAPHYAETALSVSMRHSSDYATLRTIAQIVEQQLSFALKIHCWWLGNDELVAKSTANVELNKVFFDQSVSADELRALLLAIQAGKISFKTFYGRLMNTGWTREGIDADQEIVDIKDDIKNLPLPVVPPAAGDLPTKPLPPGHIN